MNQETRGGRRVVEDATRALEAEIVPGAAARWSAAREVAVTGAGIGGGFAGGALAGLASGPGAPVCVAVGALVGRALAAFGVNVLW